MRPDNKSSIFDYSSILEHKGMSKYAKHAPWPHERNSYIHRGRIIPCPFCGWRLNVTEYDYSTTRDAYRVHVQCTGCGKLYHFFEFSSQVLYDIRDIRPFEDLLNAEIERIANSVKNFSDRLDMMIDEEYANIHPA